MPEHDPEQELGPKISSAFRSQADAASELRGSGLAGEARRRVRKRRQALTMAAAAAVVAVAIGGVWNVAGSQSPSSSTAADSSSKEAAGSATGSGKTPPGIVAPREEVGCPPDHPILKGGGPNAVAEGTGLDLATQVSGLQACRYGLTPGATTLLGQQRFDATVAQQVIDAIKVLPERNPDLPVFKCTPRDAQPSEAIVLRFDTPEGIREVWVEYDGCDSAGFFTGSHTYGLYPAPLKLFMVGSVRPGGGTFLSALKGW